MTAPEDNPPSHSSNRWYDNDPALHRAMEQLRTAPDNYQAQVALNIIKIIVEHQMEEEGSDSLQEVDSAQPLHRSSEAHRQHRRWYDMQETLSSAIQLLADSPADMQQRMIPSIAQMIETTLSSPTE